MNSSRHYLEQFIARAAKETSIGELVLDAGAGDCRYRAFFEHAQYEAADFAQANKSYGALTYVCDITEIPVEDERYQVVVCSQVLAHLPDPEKALRELHRVLRPGGRLFLTAPLFFHENEKPYDFHRFTQFGLRRVVESAGFTLESLDWLEGYCGTIAYQLGMAAQRLPTSIAAYGGGIPGSAAAILSVMCRPVFAALACFYSEMDRRHRWTGSGMCKNYAVIARRPQN